MDPVPVAPSSSHASHAYVRMKSRLELSKTAVILIGYQNDYFASDGALVGALEDGEGRRNMLASTVSMLEALAETEATLISTPIVFTQDYSELVEPTGILKTIVDVGAFREAERGSETIPELAAFGDRILEIPGKRGLNAFSNTELGEVLQSKGIEDVVLAGVVTSICIDSTGRAAHERGYRVSVLSDCTAGRTFFEQEFYCERIFPLYAAVIPSRDLYKPA
jgi:nicotinamidase-related amidase